MNSLINYTEKDVTEIYKFRIVADPMYGFEPAIRGEIQIIYKNGSLLDIVLPFNVDKLDKEKLYILNQVYEIIGMITRDEDLSVLKDREHKLFEK